MKSAGERRWPVWRGPVLRNAMPFAVLCMNRDVRFGGGSASTGPGKTGRTTSWSPVGGKLERQGRGETAHEGKGTSGL